VVIFRDELLDGRRVAHAGPGDSAVLVELRRLGAWAEQIPTGDIQLSQWVAGQLPLDALVHEACFEDGADAFQTTLERAWVSARAVATGALIPDCAGGRLLFVAPRPDLGSYAHAARAALDNLARTLSVEWARFGVTAVAIFPGAQTSDDDLAGLVCYLISDAGGYFSGCRFDLGVAAVS
jgi:NAD(P)-dependent dehydrogenase (short-subunit alcohol dehydrogenase family)